MAETNALMPPNVSSYSNPTVNALLAGGGSNADAMDAGTSNALKIAGQAQQLQSGQVTISQQQYNLAKSHTDAMDGVYHSLYDNPDPANATWHIGQLTQQGLLTPDQAMAASQKILSFGGDRNKIQQFALDGMNLNQTHREALEQAAGTTQLVDTGGGLKPVRVVQGPNAGVYEAGGAVIPATLSPGQKVSAGRTVISDKDGGGTFVPGSNLYDDRGNYKGGQGSTNALGSRFVAAADGQGTAPPPAAPTGNALAPAATAPVAPAQSQAPPPIVGGNKPPPLAPDRVPAALPPSGPGQTQGQGAAPPGGQGGAQNPPTAPSGPEGPGIPAGPVTDRLYQNALGVVAQAKTMDPATMSPSNKQAVAMATAIVARYQREQATPATAQGGAPAASTPAQGGVSPGRQPPAPVQAPTAGQGQVAPAPVSGVGPGGMTESLSPGRQASLTAGANGYSALSSDVSAPGGVNQRLFQLRTAMDALRNTQTGLGTAQRQQLVSYMASLPGGLDKWMPGVDPNSATAYDVATKYLNAYAMNTPGAARSDAALSTAQSANANTSGMMQKAAQDVTLSNIGLELGRRALANAFEKSGADPGTFNKFAQQWGQGVDPRAFALGDMTPAERGALFSGLQGQQRVDFLNTVRKGMAAGVIHKGDLTGATGNGP